MKGGNQERLCVACRKLDRKEHMIRFVCEGGKAAVDISGKIQARGAYVCRNEECIRRLQEKHFLRKALHLVSDDEALEEAEAIVRAGSGEADHA